jgi:hypothetical protein
LFAAYQDRHIELKYSAVQNYSLACDEQGGSGHGDWLYDEIRLSQRGYVLHEIEWSYRENYHGQSALALARLITTYDVAKYFDDLPT